jgi:hypothetical protein
MTGVDAHCPYCALQCGMAVGPAGAISPRRFPTNRRGLCRKGWTAGEPLGHPERRAPAATTWATTGCGTCADAVEGLCTWLNEADPGPAVVAGKEGAT